MSMHSGVTRAVIDVGTNSVKLLVAKVDGGEVTPICEESKQTRLGSGFYATRRLQPERIDATAQAVAAFVAKARFLGALTIRLIGTSAARDAHNSDQLITAIRERAALSMEVISGDCEAEWVFRGVTTDRRLATSALLILDVGGGSSEFIVGENCELKFANSYQLGTVRTLESLKLQDPPGVNALQLCRDEVSEFLRTQITPPVSAVLRTCALAPQLIGTGGTATILARMAGSMEDFDRERIESIGVTLNEIRGFADFLWQSSLARRQQIAGLPPKRADVILAGVVIYQVIMEQFGFPELRISTRGLRYSAVLQERE